MATVRGHITAREVTQALEAADPGVLFVSARLLQRIIRIDQRLPTFVLTVPHRKSYWLSRDRLFDVVGRFELELDIDHKVTDQVILLERPDEDELLQRSAAQVLFDYWRLLFHVRVHMAFERRMETGQFTPETALTRLRHLGLAEFAEARSVLQRDEMLLPPRDESSIYVEFAAVFLELWYFAPEHVGWYFPSIRNPAMVADLVAEDIDHVALHQSTRVPGAAERAELRHDEDDFLVGDASQLEGIDIDPLKPSPPAYWRCLARAERVGSLGNVVKAAILRKKASRQALADRIRDAEALAFAELERLARRLRPVLGLNEEETLDWANALAPLLQHADQGLRAPEAQLLYDLQKVCVEHERGVFAVDLLTWIRTRGRVPLRRSLPLLRQVLVTKHLQSAARKLTASRLTGESRARLSILIRSATERAKQKLRDRVRPRIVKSLELEGLVPRNAPERVAFRKIVEVLLDRIVEQGYLNMGYLRDTLSQNNLKLVDLTSLWELLTGDLLLRVDRRLGEELDGVHYRGPIYLRLSQRLSSMAFGTRLGRLLTQNLALPFGGAFLILESFRHIVHLFVHQSADATPEMQAAEQLTADAPAPVTPLSLPEPATLLTWLAIGTFLLMLIRIGSFREWCWQNLRRLGQAMRRLFIDLPAMVLRLPLIRRLLDSPIYNVAMNYAIKPLIFAICVLLPYQHRFGEVSWSFKLILFLGIDLLLNSPLGRYADVLITEQLARGWRELQMRVFAAAFRWVVDAFQWLLHEMEHVVYTVDEWLRFRTGERGWVLAVKAVLGVGWSVVTYIMRIYVTLLIEPQVNPIKHFPVVTVSHKIMLPFSIHLTQLMAAPLMPLGAFLANTIAGTTVFLLPGVFGFLVWELKENWRLYAANRPQNLKPIGIGSHNENMAGLLRLGFHSGTVPRLFTKIRNSMRKAARTGKWRAVHKHRESLHHMEESIRRFIERELLVLLAETPDWSETRLQVREIHVACQLLSIELWHGDPHYEPLQLVFEERAGWTFASLNKTAWLDTQSDIRRRRFLFAIEGLCKYAGVDLVWEQLEGALQPAWWCDVNSDGLLVWRQPHDLSTVLIQLRDHGAAATMEPPPREIIRPKGEELRKLVFGRTPLTWKEWVATWDSDISPPPPVVPELCRDPEILREG